MVKRFFVFLVLIIFIYQLLPLITNFKPNTELKHIANEYVESGPQKVGASNLVTSVVVTYRGLDTLGEIAVLFIATTGVGFVLKNKKEKKKTLRPASEILQTGTNFLLPLIFLFGIYVFVHGHLTPGGGFQGGVIITSGIVLLMLSNISFKLNHMVLNIVESLSGLSYVIMGILGLVLAAGFLDNGFISLGKFGTLFSAGAIPIIYSIIGFKVGSELTGIVEKMRK
ncbi:MAG: Na(+)/H(+) antiporter subunit B [Candidatus Cloacimonadota bacterium]|nr:Na(+)/H(+) antiporter subunit B [Candidatus Cloacimonadota bacterium]